VFSQATYHLCRVKLLSKRARFSRLLQQNVMWLKRFIIIIIITTEFLVRLLHEEHIGALQSHKSLRAKNYFISLYLTKRLKSLLEKFAAVPRECACLQDGGRNRR